MVYHLPFKPGDAVIELGGGCFPIFRPNFDIRPLKSVDRVVDFNLPLPIPDNSYDGVFGQYMLEHISWRHINQFLEDVYRILKPDGIAVFITANLLEQAKVLVNTSHWEKKLISMIFGDQNYNENSHQCGFSPEYINRILTNIGFKGIKIESIYTEVGPTDMTIEARK